MNVIEAIDKHQIRLIWGQRACLAYTYLSAHTTPITGGGATVTAAVVDLLSNLEAFQRRKTEKKSQRIEEDWLDAA